MLILMIEGDLNTARLILPRTARGHQGAEFRARTVTAYHCRYRARTAVRLAAGAGKPWLVCPACPWPARPASPLPRAFTPPPGSPAANVMRC
jgi:hypothetical protein